MLKKSLAAVFMAVLLASCASSGSSPSVPRIDATTTATAEASYKAMHARLPQQKQLQLMLAMLSINMIGVNSAHEVAGNPDLQSPSIGRIKDVVAGMSADEIIAYAAEHSTVRMEVTPQ